jgi:hypothetical protein
MKRHAFWIFLSVIVLALIILSCSEEEFSAPCGTPATVRDLTGMDGCGYAFELSDGTMVIPVWDIGFCGTPPLPKEVTEDPLYNFQFIDGKQVLIGFEDRPDHATSCMSGRPMKITCLEEVEAVAFVIIGDIS